MVCGGNFILPETTVAEVEGFLASLSSVILFDSWVLMGKQLGLSSSLLLEKLTDGRGMNVCKNPECCF